MNTSEYHTRDRGSITMEHGLLIFVVLMFLVPCGLIILASEEASSYYTVTGEPVKDAAVMKNITIVSAKDTTWNIPGATGGKVYVLADTSGNRLTISTQSFDSKEARDSAVHLYNSHPVGHGKPVSGMVVVGQQVIYATPSNSPILTEIAPVLKGKTIATPTNEKI